MARTHKRTHYISDGIAFRNRRMSKPALSKADRWYYHTTGKWVDKTWAFFTEWEEDFRLLHMPMGATA